MNNKIFMALFMFIISALLCLDKFVLPNTDIRPINADFISVLIDPGHGGEDPGKVAHNDIYEKDINLKLSEQLKNEFVRAGFIVFMTRDSDTGLFGDNSTYKKNEDLKKRVETMEEVKPDFFISIHCNAYPGSSSGYQVFYGKEENRLLAENIQTEIKLAVGDDNHREAKIGDFYVLNNAVIPAVIVEAGFLTDADDLELLQSEDHREKICRGIVNGTIKFLNIQKNSITENY